MLADIFSSDFSKCKSPRDFNRLFFARNLKIADLHKVHDLVKRSSVNVKGRVIPAAIRIGADSLSAPPFLLIAQLHGNEPAGLAGIVFAMALSEAGMLNNPILAVIGNPLAAEQYFSAFTEAPRARQELRDVYRCGLGLGGALLPDMNRIPVNFIEKSPDNHHIQRAQELYHLGKNVAGVLDIHSARGNMRCVTDYRSVDELRFSPIRSVLIGLAEAIGAHSSAQGEAVKTLKTILGALPNIKYQVGIEAGRHEDDDTPYYAAAFTGAFLSATGASKVPSEIKKENGVFDCYYVQPRWSYGDLRAQKDFADEDKIYMVKECRSADLIPKRSDRVIVRRKDGNYQVQTVMQYIVQPAGDLCFATYQYDEMEEMQSGEVVAVAVPSGNEMRTAEKAAGIFFSKPASLYDRDPSVGPWPLPAKNREKIKFCYPSKLKPEKLLTLR